MDALTRVIGGKYINETVFYPSNIKTFSILKQNKPTFLRVILTLIFWGEMCQQKHVLQ